MRRVFDVAAVLFALALASLYVTGEPLDGDEAIFAAVAQRMREFDLPVYQAGWDHKPVGIFLAYRWLLPIGGPGSLLGPHLATAAIWVATAVLLGFGARRVFGKDAFAPAVVIYAILRSYGETKAGAANTEAFLQLPLVAAGFWFLVPSTSARRMALLGGAALGVAALLKPPVALFGPAVVVAVWLLRGGRAAWTTAWGGACGALAVFALEALRIAVQGDAEGWWICNVMANQVYVEHGPTHSIGDFFAGLGREMSRITAPWVLAVVATAAGFLGAGRLTPGDQETTESTAQRTDTSWSRRAGAGLILLLTGLYLVTLGGHFFRHYWLLVYPVLTIVATGGWLVLTRRVAGPAWRTWAGRGLAVALLLFLWAPAQRVDKRRLLRTLRNENPYFGADPRAASDAIQRLSEEDDLVFVWGIQPELHLLSKRSPATRFITCAFLSGTLRHDVRMGTHPPVPDLLPGAWDTLLQDLHTYRPRLIVDTAPGGRAGYDRIPATSMPRLAAYLRDGYRLDGRHGNMDIYVRNAD